MHKEVTWHVEAKKLLSRHRQSEYKQFDDPHSWKNVRVIQISHNLLCIFMYTK